MKILVITFVAIANDILMVVATSHGILVRNKTRIKKFYTLEY